MTTTAAGASAEEACAAVGAKTTAENKWWANRLASPRDMSSYLLSVGRNKDRSLLNDDVFAEREFFFAF